MPRKKAKPAPKKPQTKTAFVLGFPHAMSAKEVVAKGKSAGKILTVKHVWAIRSDARKRKTGASKQSATRSVAGSHAATRHDHTRALRTIVIHVGVDNVHSMVDQIARELEAMAGK